MAGNSARILKQEISSLLSKGTIRVIPAAESHLGFYSRYFQVPKKCRGVSLYSSRWLFTSVDLQDDYFHKHPASTQEIFKVCVSRYSRQIPRCSIQASASSPNVQQMCRGSSHIPEKQVAENHVLIRTDNTTVVVNISRQGGTPSLRLRTSHQDYSVKQSTPHHSCPGAY